MRAVVLAVLLLGVAVAAWSFLGKPRQPDLPGVEPSAMDRITRRLTTPLTPAMTPQMTPGAVTAPPPAAGNIQDLQALKDLNDLEGRVIQLEQLVAALQSATVSVGGSPQDPGAIDRMSGRIDALEGRIVRAERQGTGVQTALAFALGQLRAAVVEGRPFQSDLERVSVLSAKIAEGLLTRSSGPRAQAVDKLRGHSIQGVLTLIALQKSLHRSAADILRAAAQSPDSDWTDSLRARLSSVVRVRRTGEVEGTDPEARLARAEARLKDDDLAAAIAEIEAMDGPAQTAASGWLATARARLDTLAGLTDLEAAVADALMNVGREPARLQLGQGPGPGEGG